MKIKRIAAVILTVAAALFCTSCGADKGGGSDSGSSADESTELIVFAAASLTEALTELGVRYTEENSGVSIIYNFDSSGTLKTQIEEGAECDIFISAGQKQMDQLDLNADASVNTDGLDCVLEGSRFDILENEVVLVVPDGNPAGITGYGAMAKGLMEGGIMLAMGNSDVPAGQYTQRILSYFGLDEDALASAGVLTYASNVKEIATQVDEAIVDCGVIYRTDAYSAGLTVVDTADADMCGQVIYPAAVIKTSENPAAAKAFLDYLGSDEADALFEEIGFTPVL